MSTDLTKPEREQIAEILERRANDIASHRHAIIKDGEPASVEWMEDAYDLTVAEEQKVVTVRTFKREET